MPFPVEVQALPVTAAGELLTLQRGVRRRGAALRRPAPACTGADPGRAGRRAGRELLRRRARSDSRLVGALRSREHDDRLQIGRLVVAPDLPGRGIGQRLLAAPEATTLLPEAALCTGARSEADLRLYRRPGYVERTRELLRAGLELVHPVESLAAQR